MTTATSDPGPEPERPRRGPGRPATITRSAILRAARQIAAEQLSIQAVASRLGVARRSVGHYVSGIDELRMLVAAAELAERLADVALPHGDWHAAVRSYASAVHEVLLANSMSATVLFEIPLSGPLELVEHFIEALVEAGFDATTAAYALEMVGDVTFAQARRENLARNSDAYPTAADAWALVNQDHDGRFEQLRMLLNDQRTAPRSLGASFEIDVIIAGLERLLIHEA